MLLHQGLRRRPVRGDYPAVLIISALSRHSGRVGNLKRSKGDSRAASPNYQRVAADRFAEIAGRAELAPAQARGERHATAQAASYRDGKLLIVQAADALGGQVLTTQPVGRVAELVQNTLVLGSCKTPEHASREV